MPSRGKGRPKAVNTGENDPDSELYSVQITYASPKKKSQLRRIRAFCDASDSWWVQRPRFLISSEFVNKLSATVVQRVARRQEWLRLLANCRFGYTCTLHKMREEIARIYSMVDSVDEDAPATNDNNNTSKELCPIYFFSPEAYIDECTLDALEEAIRRYTHVIKIEIQELRAAIAEHGGAGWYDLLKKLVGKPSDDGQQNRSECGTPTSVGSPKAVDIPNHRRVQRKTIATMDSTLVAKKFLELATAEDQACLENKLSGGLRDMHDKLVPTVEELVPEFDDFNLRNEGVQSNLRDARSVIKTTEDQLRSIAKKLEAKPPEFPPDSSSDISEDEVFDDSAFRERVSKLIQERLAEWESKCKDAMAEVTRLMAIADEWEAKLRAAERNANLDKLREEVEQLRRTLSQLETQLQKLRERRLVAQNNLQEKEQELASFIEQVAEVRRALAAIPPRSPRSNRFEELQEELEKLEALSNRLREKLKNPEARWRSIRWQLKKLFEKFSWEWEFSESEGEDDDDKPYWLRRKLASQGVGKFDPCAFVYGELAFKTKRRIRRRKSAQEKQQTTILRGMAASNLACDAAVEKLLKEWKAVAASAVGPYAADSTQLSDDEACVGATNRNLSTSLAGLGPIMATAEIRACCSKLIRAQATKARCLGQLWQCAKEISDVLPEDSHLLQANVVVQTLVARMGEQMVISIGFSDDVADAEDETRAICISIQDEVSKIIEMSENAYSIASTLQQSTKFSRLLNEFTQFRAEYLDALKELRDAVGEDVLHSCSTRLPSVQDSFCDFNETTFEPTSPNCGSSSYSSRPGSEISFSGPQDGPSIRRENRENTQPPRMLVDVIGSTVGPGNDDRGGATRLPRQKTGTKGGCQENVDFGFRPDGAGEDSLENWSLFKVNKTRECTNAAVALPAGRGLVRLPASEKTLKLSDDRAARLQQRLAAHWDFREYVAQQRQGKQEMWRSTSAPDLEVKKGPSLPQLLARPNMRK